MLVGFKNYYLSCSVDNDLEGDTANVWRSEGGYHISIGPYTIGEREDTVTGKMAVKIKWLDVRIFLGGGVGRTQWFIKYGTWESGPPNYMYNGTFMRWGTLTGKKCMGR